MDWIGQCVISEVFRIICPGYDQISIIYCQVRHTQEPSLRVMQNVWRDMGALPSTVVLRLMLMWREIKLNYMEILSSPGFCPYFVLNIISLHVDYYQYKTSGEAACFLQDGLITDSALSTV